VLCVVVLLLRRRKRVNGGASVPASRTGAETNTESARGDARPTVH
jgi:hypothetical protein